MKISDFLQIKFLMKAALLAAVCAIAACGLLLLAGPILNTKSGVIFSTSDLLLSSFVFLMLFGGAWLVAQKRSVMHRMSTRLILYGLFFGFATVALFILLSVPMDYTQFLRTRNGTDYAATTFFTAMMTFISYMFWISCMEHVTKNNKFLRTLAIWFVSVVLSAYVSLPLLFLILTPSYQSECMPKGLTASDYCWQKGESVAAYWHFMPGLTILTLTIILMVIYFQDRQKEKLSDIFCEKLSDSF